MRAQSAVSLSRVSDLSHYRPALVTDAGTYSGQWKRDGRTGAIHMRAPLTWTGVREYPQLRVNGRPARILRRPEQIFRPGYLATVERITPTHGHPLGDDGRQVLIDSDNYRRYAVGSVGDKIEREEIDGYPVPVGAITVIAREAVDAIEAGNDQVSQGFFALVGPPPEGEAVDPATNNGFAGLWQGPNGPEPYDAEHIVDPDHPVVVQYAAENPDFPRAKVGANHIAVGIPKGRGLAQAQARPLGVEGFDSADSLAGGIVFLDECPPAREVKTMKTKIKWSPTLPKGFSCPVPVPCFDEEMEATDGPELMEFFQGLQGLISTLMEKLMAAEQTAESAQGEAAAAQAQATEAQAAATEAQEAMDSIKSERDALLAEVAPLRAAAIKSAKDTAAKLAPSVGLDACEDLISIRRAAVAAKIPALAQASDAQIEGAWSVLVAGLDSGEPPAAPAAPSPGFMNPPDNGNPNTPAAPASRSRAMLNR